MASYPQQTPPAGAPYQQEVIHQQQSAAYQPPPQMNEKTQEQYGAGVPQQQQQPQQPHAHAHGHSNDWSFSFWDCFKPLDLCCLGYWCPCYVFGKTYERNKTGEKDPSGLNGMCCAWYCLAALGFSPCFQCIMRGQTRDKFNIDGNMGMDFLSACCCPCCIIVQEEKESIVRINGIDPTTGAVYQPVPQMTHP